MGFFTDAYDLFSIPVVTGLLGRLYYQAPGATSPGTLPVNVNAAVSAVALCGTLAGQLFFGWLGKHSLSHGFHITQFVVSAEGSIRLQVTNWDGRRFTE